MDLATKIGSNVGFGSTAVLLATCFAICTAAETRGADLPLYPYYYDDLPPKPPPPVREFPIPDGGRSNTPLHTPKPDHPAGGHQNKREREADKVTPAPPPVHTGETQNSAQSFSIAQVLQLALWVLLAAFAISNIRRGLRFVDSLFDRPPNDPRPEDPHSERGNDPFADWAAFSQSEMSAADFRSQTEILRALKEQLDAQGDAARATIRREREREQQDQYRKETR